jgi:hypothetical protein
MPEQLVAFVLAYRGILILHGCSADSRENWTPAGDGRFGCVVTDTAKHLGVSPEALELLKTVKPSHDAIGDVDWWKCGDGTYAFGWLGGHLHLVDPAKGSGSRDYVIGDHVVIENNIPDEGAMKAIDAHLASLET